MERAFLAYSLPSIKSFPALGPGRLPRQTLPTIPNRTNGTPHSTHQITLRIKSFSALWEARAPKHFSTIPKRTDGTCPPGIKCFPALWEARLPKHFSTIPKRTDGTPPLHQIPPGALGGRHHLPCGAWEAKLPRQTFFLPFRNGRMAPRPPGIKSFPALWEARLPILLPFRNGRMASALYATNP